MNQTGEFIPRSSFRIQCDVVFAIFVRELKTRFGSYKLGYFWAILEPVAHIAILVSLFSFRRGLRGTPLIAGVDLPIFFITGVVPFFMFRNIVTQLMVSVDANRGLLSYQHVKPMDAMIARALLEVVIYLFVYIALLAAVWRMGYKVSVADLLGLVAIYGVLVVLSFGLGMIACVANTLHKDSHKIITMVMQPLYFISGVIFPLRLVPEEYHKWLLWNPLIHAIELSRQSFFASYPARECSIAYLLLCTVAIFFMASILYRAKRIEMVMS